MFLENVVPLREKSMQNCNLPTRFMLFIFYMNNHQGATLKHKNENNGKRKIEKVLQMGKESMGSMFVNYWICLGRVHASLRWRLSTFRVPRIGVISLIGEY